MHNEILMYIFLVRFTTAKYFCKQNKKTLYMYLHMWIIIYMSYTEDLISFKCYSFYSGCDTHPHMVITI